MGGRGCMGQHRVAWGSTGWHGGSTGWHWVAQGGMEWHMAEMVGIRAAWGDTGRHRVALCSDRHQGAAGQHGAVIFIVF